MKYLLFSFFLFVVTVAEGADQRQQKCEQQFEIQLKEMQQLVLDQGGTSYTKMLDRSKSCVETGKCGKPDLMLASMEMMVDEEFVSLQRAKVAAMRSYFYPATFRKNDACTLLGAFPALREELGRLSKLQYDRMETLSEKFFPK